MNTPRNIPIHFPPAPREPAATGVTLQDVTTANTLALQRVARETAALREQLAIVCMATERLAEVAEALAAGLAARAALAERQGGLR